MPSRPCVAPGIDCLRPIRIFKAESFRLAALFALVFLALTGALLGTVLWIVEGTERNTLVSANDADISTVSNGFQAEGLDEAMEVVRQRLGAPESPAPRRHRLAPEAYLVIQDLKGRVLAGNLPALTCDARWSVIIEPPPDGGHHPRRILGRCTPLGSGAQLYVGRDIAPITITRNRILHAFAWVALGTCGFAVLGGLFLGRRFMARVDAVTQTCERVIAGSLGERIPMSGRDDEWDRLARAINEMLDRIAVLLENLQQVSSDVAHDLRTPLTRLRNRLEEARDRSTGIEDYSGAIGRAIEDTDQVLSMFAALLRISQIEAGTRAHTFADVNLSELLQRAYELYLPVAEDCGHALWRDLKPDVHIRGDEELLTQMYSNLIENALRHTPRGVRIGLVLDVRGADALTSVVDDGPGVPREDRDKVLRRFYRGSASRSTEGHGLGLSLAAAIAQLHGTKLQLEDAGPGLRVDIAFRRATA
jgi:signal transduction histidine kinase